MGPDGQKHDCRDWPGVGNNSGGGAQAQGTATVGTTNPMGYDNMSQYGLTSPSPPPTQSYNQAPPTGETLIGVQAKKTWENYFKMLEPLTANSAAIVSAIEETNKHLMELGNKLKSLEDTMTVSKIRSSGNGANKKQTEEKKEE